jgi:hypothetical protein
MAALGGKQTLSEIASAVKSVLRPDGFAAGLFLFGLILLFVPLMAMAGVIVLLSAIAYWIIMMAVKAMQRRGG